VASLPGAARSRLATKAGWGEGGGEAVALWRRAAVLRGRRWVPCYPFMQGWDVYPLCAPRYLVTQDLIAAEAETNTI
jgi:hypothetical protein